MAKKRFGVLKDQSRQAYCKSCRVELPGGTERMFDNHADTFGPACMECVGKAGGRDVMIDDASVGKPKDEQWKIDIEARVKALEDAATATF